ncbi:DUF3966 domain-containing protein [Bacillus sp. D-CC]
MSRKFSQERELEKSEITLPTYNTKHIISAVFS